MADSFDERLDRCLDRILAGEDIDSILAGYPDDSTRLRPLLSAYLRTSQAFAFTPSRGVKQAARQQFTAEMTGMREARRRRQPWLRRAVARPATWGAIATATVAVAVTFMAVRPALAPSFTSSQEVLKITPVPSASGNFVFLVSDDVNAIADFESVVVGIQRIGLQRGEDGRWIEFQPEAAAVDLTQVPGDAVKEVWRGDIPAGNYRQVVLYVDNVTGILKTTRQQSEIKLPSNKLHVAIAFEVTDDSVTSFTYDMTVFATGNERNSRYILKPQAGESGADQQPRPPNGEAGKNPHSENDRNAPPQRPTSLPKTVDKPLKKET